MKMIWLILIGGLLVFGFIYHMNKVAPEPMPGLPGAEQNETSPAPSADKFEPLILDSRANMPSFSLIRSAHAEEAAAPVIEKEDLRSMGSDAAPIKIYVFSSLTCSHCKDFHTVAIPSLKKDFIDTGKAQLIYVDLPFDRRALSGAMLARCVRPENYFPFLEVLFENQDSWAFQPNAQDIIMGYAALEGMTAGDVKACLADTALLQKIVSDRDAYMKKYNIQGTPTTVIVKGMQTEIIGGADEGAIRSVLKRMN